MTTSTHTVHTTRHPLIKDRAFTPTAIKFRWDRELADAHWATGDGYLVYRTGTYRYWVRELDGRWSRQGSLADAERDIAWLRQHGR